jgi:hypothetical protein
MLLDLVMAIEATVDIWNAMLSKSRGWIERTKEPPNDILSEGEPFGTKGREKEVVSVGSFETGNVAYAFINMYYG